MYAALERMQPSMQVCLLPIDCHRQQLPVDGPYLAQDHDPVDVLYEQ